MRVCWGKRGWGGGGVTRLFENIWSRIIRLQTNIGYVMSKKWAGICFYTKINRRKLYKSPSHNVCVFGNAAVLKSWGIYKYK